MHHWQVLECASKKVGDAHLNVLLDSMEAFSVFRCVRVILLGAVADVKLCAAHAHQFCEDPGLDAKAYGAHHARCRKAYDPHDEHRARNLTAGLASDHSVEQVAVAKEAEQQ